MIRITKPLQAPQILQDSGPNRRAAYCRDFAVNSADYRNGKQTFIFDSGIYGHKDVKAALVSAQHSKCCFCESKIGHDGDVEHFRPKAAYRQSTSQPLLRPGYYWLAYEWSNLFLACSACNQRHKRNLFPLVNPNQRAQSDADDIRMEQPLFLDPAEDNPEGFISFRQEIAYSIRGNRRGRMTIEALGLNREIMNERRRHHLRTLEALQQVVDQGQTRPQSAKWKKLVTEAKAIIDASIQDDAEFASMARALHRGR